MKNLIVLFYFVYLICDGRSQKEEDCNCKLNVDTLMDIQFYPIYIRSYEEGIIYPKHNDSDIIFETGERFEIHCTGYAGLFIDMEHYHSRYLQVKCLYGYMFEVKGKQADIRGIRCAERVDSTAHLTKVSCGTQGKLIRVGFEIVLGFLLQYIVCFNFQLQTTEYSYSKLMPLETWTKSTRAKKRYNAHYFSVPDRIYRLYIYERILQTVNEQLGRNDSSWMQSDKIPHKIYIRRFDLVAASDWFWEYEKTSTQFYINIVPHFSSIPWFIVKMILRLHAIENNVTLDLFTGTYGQLKLPHKNGTLIPMFLESKLKQVPFPELLWKVAYDKVHKLGIAFIATNNYYARGNYTPLCQDISWRFPWMNDYVHQYVYICSVHDWYKIISNSFPDYEVNDLLSRNLNISKDYFDMRKHKNKTPEDDYNDES